jgi:hypothetical protein
MLPTCDDGNCDPEKPPEDLERRHDKTREFPIDARSLAMPGLSGIYSPHSN